MNRVALGVIVVLHTSLVRQIHRIPVPVIHFPPGLDSHAYRLSRSRFIVSKGN